MNHSNLILYFWYKTLKIYNNLFEKQRWKDCHAFTLFIYCYHNYIYLAINELKIPPIMGELEKIFTLFLLPYSYTTNFYV